jgi:hypothetical protein
MLSIIDPMAPMSVQLLNCPNEWTQDEIFELFHENNVGFVRNVKFVPRTDSISAYIDLVSWYQTEEAANMIYSLTRHPDRCLNVVFSDELDEPTLTFINVPRRAKKTAQNKLLRLQLANVPQVKEQVKEEEALNDVYDYDVMYKEAHALLLHEQEIGYWAKLECGEYYL